MPLNVQREPRIVLVASSRIASVTTATWFFKVIGPQGQTESLLPELDPRLAKYSNSKFKLFYLSSHFYIKELGAF